MTVTAVELAAALHVDLLPDPAATIPDPNDADQTIPDPALVLVPEEITRLLAVAGELVMRYAPDATDVISNEAVTRCAGYLWADSPELRTLRKLSIADGIDIEPRAVGSALRLSGASALLSSWRVRRAVRVTT